MSDFIRLNCALTAGCTIETTIHTGFGADASLIFCIELFIIFLVVGVVTILDFIIIINSFSYIFEN